MPPSTFSFVGHSLLRLEGHELGPVDFGADAEVPCVHVTAGAGTLLSMAGQEVWTSRDGVAWTALVG
ncbi:hypothetical protein [Pyxidicoccus caerfyrddinensis]|uniref:hypothetical protein n=1 Tax=Pyxidicoccus caerfyrddinensis TaxID=2709663 RepID=UPI0013DC7373|nr:hypothetical protein [Pyxidicoccus caerfyrddinensis]